MHKLVGATLLVCLAAPWQAYALDSTHPLYMESSYVTTQYAQFTYKDDAIPGKYKPAGIVVKVGGNFNRYFAVEGRIASGVVSDSSNEVVGGTPVKVSADIDYMYGVYAVGTLPVMSRLDVYGVLGYTRGKATEESSSTLIPVPEKKDAVNGYSYGLGVGWKLDEDVSVSLEYMSYMSKSGFDSKALAIGLSQRF